MYVLISLRLAISSAFGFVAQIVAQTMSLVVLGYATKDDPKQILSPQLSEYNATLIVRGSLTLWVNKEALFGWYDGTRTGKHGAPRIYSDTAITGMAMLSAAYWL